MADGFEVAFTNEVADTLEELNEVVIEAATFGLQRLVEMTNDVGAVFSGAYRISHHIETLDGEVLYEDPERPPGDLPFRHPNVFNTPDTSPSVAQMARNYTGGSVVLTNGRFYQDFVEDKYAIYETVAAAIEDKIRASDR